MLTKNSSPALLLASALLSVGLVSFPATAQEATEGEAAAPASQTALPAITVSAVTKVELRDRVLASGLVGPVEQVQVQPLIEGQPIETLEADVGDVVQKDQVLARLSRESLALQESQGRASLAAARAQIAQAEASKVDAEASAAEARRVAERTATLRQQGSATQAAQDTANAAAVSAEARVAVAVQSLEAARAQYDLTEAQLANVALQQARTEIRSPVAGEVLERNALVGSIATAAGAPMFVIMKDGALEVSADVAEADVLKLKKGQKAILRFGTDSAAYDGTVRLVEPGINLTTRQGRARITLDDPKPFRSGMFMLGEIIVSDRQTLAVPITAVGTDASGGTVMRVRDGVVEQVKITTGFRDGALVEITGGLEEGDLVVTKAGAFVRPGDKINPVPAATGTN